jgi:hypothetical protein
MPGEDTDAVRVAHRTLAVDELEAWLRMNRGSSGWPAAAYEHEINRLAVRHLLGDGWTPGAGLTCRWRAVVDGVHEAGIGAWRLATRTEPWTEPGGFLDRDAAGQ